MAAPRTVVVRDDRVTVVEVSRQGAPGDAGPNAVTAATTTTLAGLLYGDGEHVTEVAPPVADGLFLTYDPLAAAYFFAAPAGGGGSYTLPAATASVLGGVKVGANLTITAGVLAVVGGAANGLATLGADQKLTASQLPDLAVIDYLGASANQAAMLALAGQKGDWTTRTDLGTVWLITGNTPTQLASWTQLSYPTAPVTTVAGRTGAVTLTTADLTDSANLARLNAANAFTARGTFTTTGGGNHSVVGKGPEPSIALWDTEQNQLLAFTLAYGFLTVYASAPGTPVSTPVTYFSVNEFGMTLTGALSFGTGFNIDAGLARTAAGVLQVTDGGQGVGSLQTNNLTATGVVTIPTPSAGNNSTLAASTAFVQTAIATVVGAAPAALDTLVEIAAQLATDESAVGALTTTVSGKLAKASNLSDLTDDAAARTNLGLGTAATTAASAYAAALHTHTPTDITGLGPLATLTPTGTANATTYLRGDGAWTAVAGGATVSTGLTDSANLARLDAANTFTATQRVVGGDIEFDNGKGPWAKDATGTYRPLMYLDAVNNLVSRNESASGNTYYGIASPANTTGYVFFQTKGVNVLSISPDGDGTFTGPVTAARVKTQAVTVASLVTAATAGAGDRSFVTDATATTFGSVVAGGGSNAVPVYSDGTSWRVG